MYQVESSQAIFKSKANLWKSLKRYMGSTVFTLGLTSLFTDISSEMVSTILPLYLVLSLHISPFQYGVIDGLYQGASILVRLLSGFLSDRFQRPKEIAAAGYIFSALNKIGFLVGGTTFAAIGALVLLDRVGKGIRTPSRDALIAASSKDDNLATSFGVHRAMDTFGAMAGPLLAVFILSRLPGAYPVVFAVSMGFALIGVLVILLFVPSTKKVKTDAPKLGVSEIYKLFRLPRFGLLVAGTSLLALVTISDSFIYLTLQKMFVIPPSSFPLLYIVVAATFMVLAIPLGRLADKYGRARVFIFGYLLLAGIYAALRLPVLPSFVLPLILLGMGLFYAATDGVLTAMASKLLPSHIRATGLSLLATGSGLAKLISSISFGYLWGQSGISLAFTVFLAGFILVLTGFIYYLRKK